MVSETDYRLETRVEGYGDSGSSSTATYGGGFEGAGRRGSSDTTTSSDRTYSDRVSFSPASEGSYSLNSLAQSPESSEKYRHVHQANGGCQCGH